MNRRSALKMLGVLGLLLTILWFVVVGLPKTPMSVAQADRLFGEGLRIGQGRDAVENWLASQGITRPSEYPEGGVKYYLFDRSGETHLFKVFWMGAGELQSWAKVLGLDIDSVQSFIRVNYPDAARYPFDHVGGDVYLFFDGEKRLLQYLSHERHIML
jgi:hypothetical protein